MLGLGAAAVLLVGLAAQVLEAQHRDRGSPAEARDGAFLHAGERDADGHGGLGRRRGSDRCFDLFERAEELFRVDAERARDRADRLRMRIVDVIALEPAQRAFGDARARGERQQAQTLASSPLANSRSVRTRQAAPPRFKQPSFYARVGGL